MATADHGQQQLQDLQQQLGTAGQQISQLQQMSRGHQQPQPGNVAMDETKGNELEGEGTDDGADELRDMSKWCKHFGLSKYDAALREAGLEEYGLIAQLEDDDIKEMIDATKMNKLRAKAFKKAVKAVVDGTYPPKVAAPATNGSAIDPALAKLRESRKDWKGKVYRMPDPENVRDGKQTRTAIFIGQTGAGKTTLINSMCNYMHSVGYDEQFRYKLIMEEKDAEIDTKDHTKSQTQRITKYHLRELPAISFAMNVIDTPGFGDTEGPEQDKRIRAKFRDFFNQEDRIDAIYFVIKSSDTRLGAIQKYIFNMVLDLFGNDVRDNIFILFTFSDGAKPPALDAVNKLKVPFKAYYQINNSGFGTFNPDEMQQLTHHMFFDLGMKQFEVIFEALGKVKPVSTKLTRETLKERDQITNRLHNIGQNLKTALAEIDGMHKTQKFIQANKDSMDANKNFKFPDQECKQWKEHLPSGRYTTYCSTCVYTCHEHCGIPDNAQKRYCAAMTDGYCTECPKKCEWHIHVNKPYVIKREMVTVWKTKGEMAKKFKLAEGKKAKYEDFMRASIKKIDQLEQNIIATIKLMKGSVNRLRQIALNTEVLTDDQYFDTLIQTEKDERKPGWDNRVQQLENMKKQNKLLRNVVEEDEEKFLNQAKFRSDQNLKQYRQAYSQQQNQPEDKQTVTTEHKVFGFTVYSKTTKLDDKK